MSDADNRPVDPSDLENLLNGLDMTPDWARSDPGVRSEPSQRRERSGGDRPRGGRPGGPRAPRGGEGRRNMAGVRVRPRQDGGGESSHFQRPARAPRLPVHVDFIPDKQRLSKVVKIIRSSHRAFPLSEIASKFMENPGFIAVKLTVREKAPDAEEMTFYQCRADGMVFSEQAACEAYILNHGIPEYFESESREVDPPAGNYVCVGRHRRSNTLIGPPNWHGYAKALEEARLLHAPNQDREHFSADIEMVHGEEEIDAWKKQVSLQTFYRLKPEEKAAADEGTVSEGEEAAKTAETADTSEVETADVTTPDTTPDAEAAAGTPVEAVQDSTEVEELAEADAEEVPAAEPEDVAVDPSSAQEQVEPADERPYDLSREQVEQLFRETFLPRFIAAGRRAIMPGYLVEKLEDPGIQSSVEFHLRREQQKPSSIIFALRPAFKHMRLQLFRHNGVMHVSGVHPHPLPADEHVAEDLRRILCYLEEHDGCPSKDVLVALGPEQGEGVEPTPELVSHLHWLIEKGHVIEFSDGTLSLPHQKRS